MSSHGSHWFFNYPLPLTIVNKEDRGIYSTRVIFATNGEEYRYRIPGIEDYWDFDYVELLDKNGWKSIN